MNSVLELVFGPFGIALSLIFSFAYGSNSTNLSTYDNRNLGFEYPSEWIVIPKISDSQTCLLFNYCLVTLSFHNGSIFFEIASY